MFLFIYWIIVLFRVIMVWKVEHFLGEMYCIKKLSTKPTLFVNLDHELIYKRNLVGIFILSLVIISFNYFYTIISPGPSFSDVLRIEIKETKFYLCPLLNSPMTDSWLVPDEIPVFSEFEAYMMAGGLRSSKLKNVIIDVIFLVSNQNGILFWRTFLLLSPSVHFSLCSSPMLLSGREHFQNILFQIF